MVPLRAGYGDTIAARVIDLTPGDTNVGITPFSAGLVLQRGAAWKISTCYVSFHAEGEIMRTGYAFAAFCGLISTCATSFAQDETDTYRQALDAYTICNFSARQPGDPVSLALSARDMCLREDSVLSQAMHRAYQPAIVPRGMDRTREMQLEANAALIVKLGAKKALDDCETPSPTDPDRKIDSCTSALSVSTWGDGSRDPELRASVFMVRTEASI
jgi:hypothetical protein